MILDSPESVYLVGFLCTVQNPEDWLRPVFVGLYNLEIVMDHGPKTGPRLSVLIGLTNFRS